MVSLLTVGFGLPIHQAVGTALASMLVVASAGTVSHFREGNINVAAGVTVGVAGMVGAVLGAGIGQEIPDRVLQPAAGFALWFLAFLVWFRTRMAARLASGHDPSEAIHTTAQIGGGAVLGVSGGIASAFFGVGMAPFIQLGLLTVFRLSLVRTVGTTMLALVFISLGGSIALARHGDVSYEHLLGVTIGMMAGSYAGAKLTGRASAQVLRWAIVITPFVAGTLLVFG